MWAPLFVTHELTGATLERLLPALVGLDEDYLRTHPRTPALYRSGVRYQEEKEGEEEWLTIPFVMDRGVADCEDLVAWRVAELRVRGHENAKAMWLRPNPNEPDLFHIVVRRANGTIEDPSYKLGMKIPRGLNAWWLR